MPHATLRSLSVLLLAGIALPQAANAQCCAGGSGSSMSSGNTVGVLGEHEVELGTSVQWVDAEKFYRNDQVADRSLRTFDGFNSAFQSFKAGYGLTDKFTFSVEGGYYHYKEETGLNGNPATTFRAKGPGDLILFPRYNIFQRTKGNHRQEATLGLGYKLPLGSYNDSTGNVEPFSGQLYYVSKPTAVQLSSGGQDIIFYAFLYQGYLKQQFKVYANAFYIHKGWNPNGEKLGDYASVSLFAGKTLLKNLGFTVQLRYEWMDVMQTNESVLLFGRPSNYFPEATGYSKVFITPQLSYTWGKFTVYAASDLPVYQYLNTSEHYTQVGSQHQTTVGLSFRFKAKKRVQEYPYSTTVYQCPMHPEETSAKPGHCPKCGMDLEIRKDSH